MVPSLLLGQNVSACPEPLGLGRGWGCGSCEGTRTAPAMQGGRGVLGGVNPEEVDWADEELGAKKAGCLQRLTEAEVPDQNMQCTSYFPWSLTSFAFLCNIPVPSCCRTCQFLFGLSEGGGKDGLATISARIRCVQSPHHLP